MYTRTSPIRDSHGALDGFVEYEDHTGRVVSVTTRWTENVQHGFKVVGQTFARAERCDVIGTTHNGIEAVLIAKGQETGAVFRVPVSVAAWTS